VAAAIGAAVAAGVAVAASPLMPIGAARLAEPDPGVSADALVLAAGAAAIVVLLVAWAAWPAWRLASTGTRWDRASPAPGRWPRLTAWLAGAGVPVTAAAGVRLALEPGRGRTAVPVRAALAGTALSVLAVTAALTFGASIDRTPAVLPALLAVIGVAVLGQFIVVSGRRRRRDFAILKTLGLYRRQVSAITAWQVSTLTGLALLAGLPLGVAAGRWSWALFAHGLGIPAAAITPTWPVLLMVPAVIVIANAAAFWPARASGRLSPAEVLRAE
jgi:hypothetical protein